MKEILNINQLTVGDLLFTHNSEGEEIDAIVTDLSESHIFCVDIQTFSEEIIEGDICYDLGSIQKGQVYLRGNAELLSVGGGYMSYGESVVLHPKRQNDVRNALFYIKGEFQ